MADPGKALHKALLASLKSACSCDVWDAVPQDTGYPYILIDTDVADNEDYLTERMDRRFIYLSIWSRAHGSAEVRDIIAEIQSISELPMTLDSGVMCSLRVERVHVNREPDNLTFMGHVTLRVFTFH